MRERADVDVDRLDGPQFAAPALVDHLAVIFQHPLAAAGNDTTVTPGRRHHQRPFMEGPGLGLLAKGVLAVVAGLDQNNRVPVVGRGAMDGVDIGAGQQVAEVDVGLAILVAIVVVDAVAGVVAEIPPHVADGHVLHVAAAKEGPLVAGTLISDADSTHDDAVARRRAVAGPQGRLRNQVGASDRGCGRSLEKVSPVGTLFHGTALPFLKHGRMGPRRAIHAAGR